VNAYLRATDVFLVDTDQTSRHAGAARARESSSIRTVNATMRELSGSFTGSEPIAFFCECRNSNCFASVWMSASVFDATVAGHTGWMLLEGHEPSALWHTRGFPPLPETSRALRAVPDVRPDDPGKHRSILVHHRLARAS
jgi:hypothetical protein